MQFAQLKDYRDFQQWTASERELFWAYTVKKLGVVQKTPYTSILNLDLGLDQARWLHGSRLNIAESCFQADETAIALVFQEELAELQEVTYGELRRLCNRFANSLKDYGVRPGEAIAIDMPMTVEAVVAYLGAILYGVVVVSIADSFAPQEIRVRLELGKVRLVFTQDVINRSSKILPLYAKVKEAGDYSCVVVQTQSELKLQSGDSLWELSENEIFDAYECSPQETMTLLFSSGTTGAPKAIPWDHTTPIKSAADGYYHHDIHAGDVVCWPTNLGWMMGPWLVFASLINKGTVALYYGAPLGSEFRRFVQDASVNMLGVVPSLVRSWKASECMEAFDWSSIKCFSSTGECSNPEDMQWLMNLAGGRPIIEYCGGTETGGGYITSTLVQENKPSEFSSPALGGSFVILDEEGHECDEGEVFLLPPIMGLSTHLLNRDHFEAYYAECPEYNGELLRRHGDRIQRLNSGYFRAQGRNDDSMNLGGIKVSSTQIEELLNKLPFILESAAIAVAQAGGGPANLVVCFVANGAIPENALQQMQKLVRSQLNPLFKVSACRQMDNLPRTASNKVMRRKLRELK